MLSNDISTERIPVSLPNGTTVKIEVSSIGRRDVAFDTFSFDEITEVLSGVTLALRETLAKAKPQKASVTFGLEISLESGKITSAIVQGSGRANLQVTLEWGNQQG